MDDGAYISVSFPDVSPEQMHQIWIYASSMNMPFSVHVSHPIKDEDE